MWNWPSAISKIVKQLWSSDEILKKTITLRDAQGVKSFVEWAKNEIKELLKKDEKYKTIFNLENINNYLSKTLELNKNDISKLYLLDGQVDYVFKGHIQEINELKWQSWKDYLESDERIKNYMRRLWEMSSQYGILNIHDKYAEIWKIYIDSVESIWEVREEIPDFYKIMVAAIYTNMWERNAVEKEKRLAYYEKSFNILNNHVQPKNDLTKEMRKEIYRISFNGLILFLNSNRMFDKESDCLTIMLQHTLQHWWDQDLFIIKLHNRLAEIYFTTWNLELAEKHSKSSVEKPELLSDDFLFDCYYLRGNILEKLWKTRSSLYYSLAKKLQTSKNYLILNDEIEKLLLKESNLEKAMPLINDFFSNTFTPNIIIAKVYYNLWVYYSHIDMRKAIDNFETWFEFLSLSNNDTSRIISSEGIKKMFEKYYEIKKRLPENQSEKLTKKDSSWWTSTSTEDY